MDKGEDQRLTSGEKAFAGGTVAAVGALAVVLARHHNKVQTRRKGDPSILNKTENLSPGLPQLINKAAAVIFCTPQPNREVIAEALGITKRGRLDRILGHLRDRGLIDHSTGSKLLNYSDRHFVPTNHLIDAVRDPEAYPMLGQEISALLVPPSGQADTELQVVPAELSGNS